MQRSRMLTVITLMTAMVIGATAASALTIGHYDGTREQWGFVGNGYLTEAKQWLIDQGHTLVATNDADAAFLGGVDAFFTGLLGGAYMNHELDAFEDFVNVQGGFLFIQQDWGPGNDWHAPAQQILDRWNLGTDGSYGNSSFHTVGTSSWINDPNVVTDFIGSQHAVVTSGEGQAGYEKLALDTLDRTVLGVFDAGGGRSSDVLISTDINMWDNQYGWTNEANRNLWENIWQTAEDEQEEDPIPEPATLLLLGGGLVGMAAKRFRKKS